MALVTYTFDRMKVSPKADRLLYHALSNQQNQIISGYADELAVVASGLNTYVSKGAAIVQGGLVENDEEMQVSVSANDNGYICIVIDLTQNNTSTGDPRGSDYVPINNQVRLEVVKDLIQQDLHNGGQIYTFPLASYVSTGTSITLTQIKHPNRAMLFSNELEIIEVAD